VLGQPGHFIKPEPYLRIMPPYIPWHVATVRVSGVFEILGGLGLLVPETRPVAPWLNEPRPAALAQGECRDI